MLRDAHAHRLKVRLCRRGARLSRRGRRRSDPLSILTRGGNRGESVRCAVLFGGRPRSAAHRRPHRGPILLPLFDVGVVILFATLGRACHRRCLRRIDYVQPGRSTPQDRGVFAGKPARGAFVALRPTLIARAGCRLYPRLIDELRSDYVEHAGCARMNEFIARAIRIAEPNERYA